MKSRPPLKKYFSVSLFPPLKYFASQYFPSSKKGLGVGQVFIFIIVAVTFALIMLFGYKAINDFLSSAEQVEFVPFKTALESSIKMIYTEFGSVRLETFYLPPKYQHICFVNLDYAGDDGEEQVRNLCQEDVYACSVWKDARASGGGYTAAEENVFLQPEAIQLKVHRITISDGPEGPRGYLCQDIVRGSFKLRLEGKGDRTEIMESVQEDVELG